MQITFCDFTKFSKKKKKLFKVFSRILRETILIASNVTRAISRNFLWKQLQKRKKRCLKCFHKFYMKPKYLQTSALFEFTIVYEKWESFTSSLKYQVAEWLLRISLFINDGCIIILKYLIYYFEKVGIWKYRQKRDFFPHLLKIRSCVILLLHVKG